MNNTSQKVLKAYLLLAAKDKLEFLNEIKKIEQMRVIERKDYVRFLFSF